VLDSDRFSFALGAGMPLGHLVNQTAQSPQKGWYEAMKRNTKREAFTLVEVLLVVVIMAILAATVIPQFTSSSDDAKKSALMFNLHTLRSQIELYKSQHGGTAPTLTSGNLPQLLTGTNAEGATGTPGTSYPYGPYLSNGIPSNPFSNNVKTITATTGTPSAPSGTGGWLYDATTGQIWADTDGYFTY
jgi:prepilin-type N-terminal cleavage/methylation domain-containing protein